MCSNRRAITSGLVGIVLFLSLQGWDSKASGQSFLGDAIQAQAKTISLDLGNGAKLDLVLIPSGSFIMGDANGENDEKPAHRVTISKPFYMGKHEVTQAQWEAMMDNSRSSFKGPNNPMENIGWEECQMFPKKLDENFGQFAVKFRLPTEAQWEYACRAGSTTKYSFGDQESGLGEYGWFPGNSDSKTHPVGKKKPNAWGLYDMHGNVWEWCTDWYDGEYYKQSPATDPTGPSSGLTRVLRSGGWNNRASACRSAYRFNYVDMANRGGGGFRVVCVR